MRTYFSNIIPKIKEFSQKLDDLTLIKNQNWVLINELQNYKSTYIFRDNGTLLIAENGVVTKATWEYLNSDSILIDNGKTTLLLQQAFKNEEILVLNLDGSNSYAFFINETKYDGFINSFQDLEKYLERKYLKKTLIDNNKFFFMEFYKEHGPYSAPQLITGAKEGKINHMCLIRTTEEKSYSGLRIRDLISIEKNI